ncbi:queuosine 5'-phosphate N-glycosylase/hydrolase isoform X2 [Palaemon carinicauda]|uniref:queuosine 5'-phosphate N-glycosylase/hydrolase isoform X2 n=1 Tax=Palaemon carinicauda TaxID=392227 RepID=UPI0035B5E954
MMQSRQMLLLMQNEVLPLDKGLTTEELANWVFIIDAINFNFWTPDGVPKYSVNYNGKTRNGYLAMVSAVNRAIDEGKKMYDPKYYSKLTVEDLKVIFRSDTESEMPLFEERVKVMHEVGSKLVEKFDGSFAQILKKAEGSALKLIDLVAREFPCFRDTAVYNGQEVKIYKRVQILAADIWMLYRGEGLGAFVDIDKLTIFADYRVPQAMVYFGALKYSDELMDKLKKEMLFQNGDSEEVEIRGCSMHAAELIVEETRKILKAGGLPTAGLNSIKVDYFLWDYRLMHAEELNSTPYHRVRCIYY